MRSTDPLAELRLAISRAADAIGGGDGGGREPSLERPPREELGDYSSNAAMLLAAPMGARPRDVAERLQQGLEAELGTGVERIEVAGPGFLNLFLSSGWYREVLSMVAGAGGVPPVAPSGAGLRVLVEFVSANPTGPLTAAGGRHAAYGDAVARLLEAVGHEVAREYYVNDTGGQIERFGRSIAARMEGEDPPQDGYGGEYVTHLAERVRSEGIDSTDLEAVTRRGIELMLEGIRSSLERYRVSFDRWTSERSLAERRAVEQVLERLDATGRTYESEGARWFRTTDLGDDKDRVLIRAGGEPTYFATDIAYHADKLDRGFDHLIDVLGADHHGYVARMRGAIEALGGRGESFEALIMQLVNVVEAGERMQMSKRRGDFVTLDELIDDIGVDAIRFFMLQRSHDTPIDLDLDLARRQSSENPVYYAQYAHARIASILRKAGEGAEERALGAGQLEVEAPVEPAEKALIKRTLELPEVIREAAERRAPHRICAYSQAIAADFHGFYRDCQVVGAEGEGVEDARLQLSAVTKRTIAAALGLLGISAPERM
jgi:arginyl-tRNA synthetase